MVKLRGPGLAQDASGTLAGVLIFSNSRGKAYAKKLTIPKQPRPIAQVASRAAFKFLTEQWTNLNNLQRLTWSDQLGFPDLDFYHRYVAENLRTFQLAQPPSKSYPPTRTGSVSTWHYWTLTPQGRRTQHKISVNAINAGWGTLIMRDTSPITAAAFDYVINIEHMPSSAVYSFWDGPLTPGTWYYRAKRITVDGNISGYSASRSVVIP